MFATLQYKIIISVIRFFSVKGQINNTVQRHTCCRILSFFFLMQYLKKNCPITKVTKKIQYRLSQNIIVFQNQYFDLTFFCFFFGIFMLFLFLWYDYTLFIFPNFHFPQCFQDFTQTHRDLLLENRFNKYIYNVPSYRDIHIPHTIYMPE